MIETIGNIVIVVWLLCWGAFCYISVRRGMTPIDALADLIRKIRT